MFERVCTRCGFVGIPKSYCRGSIWMEVILWVLVLPIFFFIVPALIYSAWRMTSRYKACPMCGNVHMIPRGSPMAQRFLQQYRRDLPPVRYEPVTWRGIWNWLG